MSEGNPVTLILNTELSSLTKVLQSGSRERSNCFTWP